jgi:hypothetical protein
MGIEPTSSAWKAEVLPLNYTRNSDGYRLAAGPLRSRAPPQPERRRGGTRPPGGGAALAPGPDGCRLSYLSQGGPASGELPSSRATTPVPQRPRPSAHTMHLNRQTCLPGTGAGSVTAPHHKALVEGGGFEPPKAEPSDLQSDPFGHSGTPPKRKPRIVSDDATAVNYE